MNMLDAARVVVKSLKDDGYEAYLVGGCVRDMKLGRTPKDYDICTNATPDQIITVVNDSGFKYYDAGIKYGTVNVSAYDFDFEVTTYRADGVYKDGRHPEAVEFLHDLEGDLARRDFTMNSLAYDIDTDTVIDVFGGLSDLKSGLIKAVGDPEERFKEDALRILRAVRFAIRYGFDIEDNTFKAMLKCKDMLGSVSKERVTSELEKMLTCGKPIAPMFLKCSDIIIEILPELNCCVGFDQKNKYHQHTVYEHMLNVVDRCYTDKLEIKLAALFHDIGKPASFVLDECGHGHFYGHPVVSYKICKQLLRDRLRLSAKQYDLTLKLVFEHDSRIMPNTRSVKRFLNKYDESFFRDWLILKQSDIDDHINMRTDIGCLDMSLIEEVLNSVLEEEACFKIRDLAVNGNDIMKHTGIKPGKQVGLILTTLLDEVIDGKLSNDSEVLLARAVELC